MKSFTVSFPLGAIPNLSVTFLVTSVLSEEASVFLYTSKSPSSESESWLFPERLFWSFASLSLSRLSSHQPASLRQAVCKGTSQLAWPRLINDERRAGVQVHKSHSAESRSAASPKPMSWQKSEVPGARQIP